MATRIEQLERLRQVDPRDPFVLYALAQELAKTGDTAQAEARYDDCLAADPDYLYAYFHKAKLLLETERTADALGTARLGLERARAIRDAQASAELEALIDGMT